MTKCSQYFSHLISWSTDGVTMPDNGWNKALQKLHYRQVLESRIGELERRESTWGSAYWGVRRLAEYMRKVDPGMSPHSEPSTIIGAAMSAIDELAAARVELRELRKTSGLVCHAAEKCPIVVK
jgi:hypothetical protein